MIGVRWGVLAGSPDEANPPECIWSKAFGPPGFGRLRPLDVQRIVGVSNQAELFGGHDSPAALLSWCYCDAVLRLKTRKDLVPQPLLDAAYDPVRITITLKVITRVFTTLGLRDNVLACLILEFENIVSQARLDFVFVFFHDCSFTFICLFYAGVIRLLFH